MIAKYDTLLRYYYVIHFITPIPDPNRLLLLSRPYNSIFTSDAVYGTSYTNKININTTPHLEDAFLFYDKKKATDLIKVFKRKLDRQYYLDMKCLIFTYKHTIDHTIHLDRTDRSVEYNNKRFIRTEIIQMEKI